MKRLLRELTPPFLWRTLAALRRRVRRAEPSDANALYFSESFADQLEHWGEDNAWLEVQFLLAEKRGRVLDVACGTGAVIRLLAAYPQLTLFGVDFSAVLIRRAGGLAPAGRMLVGDGTSLPYADRSFDYSYSIGSLEHFQGDQLGACIAECARVTRLESYHHVPASRAGVDEGWITPYQAYYNNSVDWWQSQFRREFPHVRVQRSGWSDPLSVGYWFICQTQESVS